MLDTGQLKYAQSDMLDLLVSSTGPKCTTNFMSFIYKPGASRYNNYVIINNASISQYDFDICVCNI